MLNCDENGGGLNRKINFWWVFYCLHLYSVINIWCLQYILLVLKYCKLHYGKQECSTMCDSRPTFYLYLTNTIYRYNSDYKPRVRENDKFFVILFIWGYVKVENYCSPTCFIICFLISVSSFSSNIV
jgi:hypothetical protein